MTYQIEAHPEISTLISYITAEPINTEELDVFLKRVVQLGEEFEAQGITRLYHILVVSQRSFDFAIGMRNLRAIQQNQGLITMRKRLNVMTILVGHMPKAFQILMTLLSSPTFGGRKMAVFTTLDPALEFVRHDCETHTTHSSEAAD